MFGKVIQGEQEWKNCSKRSTADGTTVSSLVAGAEESKYRSIFAYFFISCSLAIVCKYIFMFLDF